MGRSPCCAKEGLNRGAWTAMEDKTLTDYIRAHGEGKWRNLPKRADLKRCGKSCRLRWLNYLRPDIKRGNITHDEEDLIIRLHKLLGNRWSLIAGRLPGRTDNEIKNYWNTNLRKKKKLVHGHPISSTPKVGSCVVRTKATRCTRVFMTRPEPQNTPQSDPKSVPIRPPRIQPFDDGAAVGPDPLDDISPSVSAKDDPFDFSTGFEMDEKFLFDFLNTDFPPMSDGGDGDTTNSSLNFDHTLFSIGLNDSDPHSMSPLLDSNIDWLQDR